MVWLHFLYPVYVIYRCSIVEEWNRSTRDFGEKWFVKPARVKMLLSGLLFSCHFCLFLPPLLLSTYSKRKIYSLIPLRFVSSDLQTREEKIYLFVSGRYSFIFEEIYSGESREKEIVSDAGQHRGEAFSIISRHGKIVETREPWMRAYLAALLSIRYK